MEELIPNYTKEDFLESTAPYEWLAHFKDDRLKLKQMTTIMSAKASAVKVRNFVAMFKAYMEGVNAKNAPSYNVTEFTEQPLELECGGWMCDDFGVTGTDRFGMEVVACNHPIMPVKRFVNVDTGIEKLKIAYRKNKQWRSVVADKKTLASNNSILQLADYGVAVNSENAKYLVRYLTDIEHLNYDRIEEVNSVGRLGWIEDYGFSPYVESLEFDGELAYRQFFESVRAKGKADVWMNLAKKVRQGNAITRLVMAASFSSVLVKPCNALPFFVHLWGGTEAGKTVALMLAASVWANPQMGAYIHTFNGTTVSQELSAAFVNNLPLILDELQIVKEKKDFDQTVYTLSEGVGKSRGAKAGGLQKVSAWQNCILSSGEQPISNASSGGGAINRVIEIDCKDMKLFNDPVGAVEIMKSNYGYAGRLFVELLQVEENRQRAVSLQKEVYKAMSGGETTEKQALAASIILTADKLIDEWIFRDGQTLCFDDIVSFLSTKKQVSPNERALEFLYDYISINQNRFDVNKYGDYQGEIWGMYDERFTYIIQTQFSRIMREEGYNPTAFLSWAKRNGIIVCDRERYAKNKKISGKTCRCIWLKNMQEESDESGFVGEAEQYNPFSEHETVTQVTRP